MTPFALDIFVMIIMVMTKVMQNSIRICENLCSWLVGWNLVGAKPTEYSDVRSKGRSPEKNSCSFGFCPNEGGGMALLRFLAHFQEVHF